MWSICTFYDSAWCFNLDVIISLNTSKQTNTSATAPAILEYDVFVGFVQEIYNVLAITHLHLWVWMGAGFCHLVNFTSFASWNFCMIQKSRISAPLGFRYPLDSTFIFLPSSLFPPYTKKPQKTKTKKPLMNVLESLLHRFTRLYS